MLYGSLFLVAGAALLAITYGLVANGTANAAKPIVVSKESGTAVSLPAPPSFGTGTALGASALPNGGNVIYEQKTGGPKTLVQVRAYAGQVDASFRLLTAAHKQQLAALQKSANGRLAQVKTSQLDTLLTRSGLALAIMAVASMGAGVFGAP